MSSAAHHGDRQAKASTNRLAQEPSPYLLQHADNPVDWYPWGPEAFAAARAEDKPIFLSIGYSTCHWCHVMEHESFEDPEIAALMNEVFICVKVDREERPDIDHVYMTACQMMTGSGGWPLTLFLTPAGKPFFAGTYIPARARFNRAGLAEIIPRVAELWRTDRASVEQSAEQVTGALQAVAVEPGRLGPEVLDEAYRQLAVNFDNAYGGFGSAPKFPTPHNLGFLLRYARRAGEPEAVAMVEQTLQAMRRGGIYDHVGLGFHRYSTDARWLVPHFEKMLYDQALIALACVDTYQATGETYYADMAREILTYVRRDMTDPAGGFYSAEDADSDGVEGLYYVWTPPQIRAVLEADDAEFVIRLFGVTERGNFTLETPGPRQTGSILFLNAPLAEKAAAQGVSAEQLRARWEALRPRLLAARERRIRPQRDDKVLTDWNGLMIAALARSGRILDEPEYIHAAGRAAAFVRGHLQDDRGRLLHRYRAGLAGVDAHLDDYAFLVWGLLELYQARFEADDLAEAVRLNDIMLEQFWDEDNGGLFLTAEDAEALLVRPKDTYDGALPSGNAVALRNLLRLGHLTGEAERLNRADELLEALAGAVTAAPLAQTHLLMGIDHALGPAAEVVIAGVPGAEDTQALLTALNGAFLPNTVVILRPTDTEDPPITTLAPHTAARQARDGRATAYVCRNQQCQTPVTTAADMLAQLEDVLAMRR